jgi:hypothetical protein
MGRRLVQEWNKLTEFMSPPGGGANEDFQVNERGLGMLVFGGPSSPERKAQFFAVLLAPPSSSNPGRKILSAIWYDLMRFTWIAWPKFRVSSSGFGI